MMQAASLATFGASAGSIFLLGTAVPPLIFDALALLGVLSAFVAICSTEARLAS